MNRRFINFFLCFLLLFFFVVECTPKSEAVTPAEGLVAASLASFIISGGIELLWDNKEATAQSLIDDMNTLWGAFYDFDDSVPSSLSAFPSDSVTFDSSGSVVLSRDTAQTYQGFLDFLKNHYDMVPNSNISLIVNQGNTVSNSDYPGNSFFYNIYPSSVSFSNDSILVSYADPQSVGPDIVTTLVYSFPSYVYGTVWAYNSSRGGFCFSGVSDTSFSINLDFFVDGGLTSHYVFNSGSYTNKDGYSYQGFYHSMFNGNRDNVDLSDFCNYFIGGNFQNNFDFLADTYTYILGSGSQISIGSSLIGSVGKDIYDRIYGMLDTDTLSISAGVAEPIADEEDYIAAVVGGIAVPGTANPSVSIVGVQGVTELYPDVPTTDIDSLGLPDLGAALVRRFPFSIPWDVYNIFSALNVPATPIDVDIDFLPQSFKNKLHITGDTAVHLDLTVSPYDKLVLLVRWGCFTGFLLSLAYGTKRLIWTTGG